MSDPVEQYQVCLSSGEQPFTAQSNESLLKAGQRAGLNLRYGCANGSCGECLAFLRRGEVKPTQYTDFVFTPAQRTQNAILMCSTAAASDCLVEAAFYAGPQDIPKQIVRAKVSRVEVVGEHTKIINLRLPRTEPLRFLAGQSVSIRIRGLEPRCFAIASCPCQGALLQLHLPIDDDWQVTAANKLRRGQTLELYGPVGRFTLNEADPARDLVLLAWDEGFAPVQSIIEHAISLDWSGQMHLLWIASADRTHYLENAARAWADSIDNFAVQYLLGLDELDWQQLPNDADWYLAGPREGMDRVADRLAQPPRCHAIDEDACADGPDKTQ